MKLRNKQWMWGNWQKTYLSFAILLMVPLLITLALSVKGTPFYISGALGGIAALILGYSIFMGEKINNGYIKDILDSDLLKFTYSNNLTGLKNLCLSSEELNYPLPHGHCLLTVASAMGYEEIVDYFIEKKVKIQDDKDKKLSHPIHLAALGGHINVTKKLVSYFESIEGANFKLDTFNRFKLNCFLGNRDKVLQETKEFVALEKDCYDQSALYYALRGKVDEVIILHLLKLKSPINVKGRVLKLDQFKNKSIHFDEISLVHFAFGKTGEEVLLEILSREKKYDTDSNGVTVFMRAAQMGHLNVLKKLKDNVDVMEKDNKGLDALSYSKLGKQIEAERLIREWLEVAERERKELDAKRRSQSIAMGAKVNPDEKVKIEFEDLKLMITSTLRGMVGVEDFVNNFSHDLKNFMDKKNGSAGIVLWGSSSVGKTEISRRLSGTYKENVAKFELPGVEVKYIACCDTNIDVKKIIDGISKKTVLFLDEIDKYLSPVSGIVSESQAKGLRTSFITNFESKDIFWVFTGTFSDIRGNKKLNREILEKTLGQEFASRLDFIDFMLPDWSIDSLLKASRNVFAKDANIEYEDEAILKLVTYVMEHQGGVRSLEKGHEALKRKLRNEISSGEKVLITKAIVHDYINKENQE